MQTDYILKHWREGKYVDGGREVSDLKIEAVIKPIHVNTINSTENHLKI